LPQRIGQCGKTARSGLHACEERRHPDADWPIEDVAGRAMLVLRRFDRDGARLIAFLSTMSMLDAITKTA
jgi:hypothetical protein